MFAALALLAAVIEAVVGYPDAIYRAIGHPVTWIGRLIAWCDRTWNSERRSFEVRRLAGMATVVLLLGVGIGAGLLLMYALPHVALVAILASSLLAQRSLDTHVAAVAEALEKDGIDAGRRTVAMIVGRDTAQLDEAAVSRAAIESLAENFSDGVVAPLFWMAVAGLPGAIAYKAINTADSMIGHKSDRHLAFGWAAARLDDLVNLPASRLSALWLALAGLSWRAVAIVWRDADKHDSPNAGWPEAAMAGALGLRLNGPRIYDGEMTDHPWVGDGRAEATAADIRAALRLYRIACALELIPLAILAWLA
ncbi:MAG: adenosylcobinamide-phosphate synthase CbiB [Alphaproteobacteria bacterium]|nr:adenosylcobinamide-phosphate synthase CbiB [Alphaproteobacteria bacterium]